MLKLHLKALYVTFLKIPDLHFYKLQTYFCTFTIFEN